VLKGGTSIAQNFSEMSRVLTVWGMVGYPFNMKDKLLHLLLLPARKRYKVQ
jgi:hypothetical protein